MGTPDAKQFERQFTALNESLDIGDADRVQKAIFDLSPIANNWTTIPDEVVERLLTLLRSEAMYKSRLACHVLSYFEFEASRLSERQKWLCVGFLNAHGDEFTDTHSQQVVAELREGNYLTRSSSR
jgi:hypothetical protein